MQGPGVDYQEGYRGKGGKNHVQVGAPKAVGERGDNLEMFSRSLRSALGEVTRTRAPRIGQPKHC